MAFQTSGFENVDLSAVSWGSILLIVDMDKLCDKRHTKSNLSESVEKWRPMRYEKMLNRIFKNGSNRQISPAVLGIIRLNHFPPVRTSDKRSTKPKKKNRLKAGSPHVAVLVNNKTPPLRESHHEEKATRKLRRFLDKPLTDSCLHQSLGDESIQESFQGPLSSTPCVGSYLDLPSFSISAIKNNKSPINI